MIWTAAFWKATAERAVATFAQVAVAGLPTSWLPGVELPWWAALAGAGFAAGLSVLKSLGANRVGGEGPSLTSAERLP